MDWKEKEKSVRQVLERRFRVSLEEKNVSLRGTDSSYRFDLVSPDGKIVGEIKTYTIGKRKMPHAKIAHTSDAALFLLHAKGAKKRLLVLTDPSFYRLYLRTRQGQMVQHDGVTLELIKR